MRGILWWVTFTITAGLLLVYLYVDIGFSTL